MRIKTNAIHHSCEYTLLSHADCRQGLSRTQIYFCLKSSDAEHVYRFSFAECILIKKKPLNVSDLVVLSLKSQVWKGASNKYILVIFKEKLFAIKLCYFKDHLRNSEIIDSEIVVRATITRHNKLQFCAVREVPNRPIINVNNKNLWAILMEQYY